jgi:hypothetical protein
MRNAVWLRPIRKPQLKYFFWNGAGDPDLVSVFYPEHMRLTNP